MKIAETSYFVQVLLDSPSDLHLDEELLRAVEAVDIRALLINARIAAGDHFTHSSRKPRPSGRGGMERAGQRQPDASSTFAI